MSTNDTTQSAQTMSALARFAQYCDSIDVKSDAREMTHVEWRKVEHALALPFHPSEVDFKLDFKKRDGTVHAYIDRHAIVRRLNLVVGMAHWTYEPVILAEQEGLITLVKGMLTICGVVKVSLGDSDASAVETTKSSDTDGLKRSAQLYGIGGYLAELRCRVPSSVKSLTDDDVARLRRELAEGKLWKSDYAREYYSALCDGLGAALNAAYLDDSSRATRATSATSELTASSASASSRDATRASETASTQQTAQQTAPVINVDEQRLAAITRDARARGITDAATAAAYEHYNKHAPAHALDALDAWVKKHKPAQRSQQGQQGQQGQQSEQRRAS